MRVRVSVMVNARARVRVRFRAGAHVVFGKRLWTVRGNNLG